MSSQSKNRDIDYMTDRVVVEFDPASISKEKIKERLEKSGYNFARLAPLACLYRSIDLL
jgi:hypothetical protein